MPTPRREACNLGCKTNEPHAFFAFWLVWLSPPHAFASTKIGNRKQVPMTQKTTTIQGVTSCGLAALSSQGRPYRSRFGSRRVTGLRLSARVPIPLSSFSRSAELRLACLEHLACAHDLHAHYFGDLGGELVGLRKHVDVGHAPAAIRREEPRTHGHVARLPTKGLLQPGRGAGVGARLQCTMHHAQCNACSALCGALGRLGRLGRLVRGPPAATQKAHCRPEARHAERQAAAERRMAAAQACARCWTTSNPEPSCTPCDLGSSGASSGSDRGEYHDQEVGRGGYILLRARTS